MTMQSKTCRDCGQTKPITAFYRNATYSDGYMSSCKECKKAYQAQWREENREEHRAYSRRYHHEHREERLEYYAGWVADNGDKKAEGTARWRENNPDKMLAMRKVQNARRRALVEEAEGDYTSGEWLALKEEYGNRCLKCGAVEPDVKITPDHVVPLALGGTNDIENIQPLCWGCNAGKGATIADYRPNAESHSDATAAT